MQAKSIPLAAAIIVAMGMSASASPIVVDHGLRSAVPDGVHEVQWRRWHGQRHWHHGYPYYHRRGWGPAIGGLAAGAIIGSAIANSRAEAANDAYCSRRFKSYDPASGTYLGYDGQRHPCP